MAHNPYHLPQTPFIPNIPVLPVPGDPEAPVFPTGGEDPVLPDEGGGLGGPASPGSGAGGGNPVVPGSGDTFEPDGGKVSMFTGTTIAFSTRSNAWRSRYSFTPTHYMSVNNELLSCNFQVGVKQEFQSGSTEFGPQASGAHHVYSIANRLYVAYQLLSSNFVWKHDENLKYNSFYNSPSEPSSLEVVSNDNPSSVKIFKSVSIESNSTDWEGYMYTNKEQPDNLKQYGEFSGFENKEGFQYSHTPRSILNQGLGRRVIDLVGRIRIDHGEGENIELSYQDLIPFDDEGNWTGHVKVGYGGVDYENSCMSCGEDGGQVVVFYEDTVPVIQSTWDVPLFGRPLSSFGSNPAGGGGVFEGSMTEEGEINAFGVTLGTSVTEKYSVPFFGRDLVNVTVDGVTFSIDEGFPHPSQSIEFVGYNQEGGISPDGLVTKPNSIRLRMSRQTGLAQQAAVMSLLESKLVPDVKSTDPVTTCEDMGFPPFTLGCFTEGGDWPDYKVTRNGWLGIYALSRPEINGDPMKGPYAGIKLTIPEASEPLELFAINVDYEKTKLDGSLG